MVAGQDDSLRVHSSHFEPLGVDGGPHPDVGTRVPGAYDTHSSSDALRLDGGAEMGGSATHLDNDPYRYHLGYLVSVRSCAGRLRRSSARRALLVGA